MKFDNSYATLDPRLYHKQPPTALKNPTAGHFNPLIAERIGWNDDAELMQNWVAVLGGEIIPDGFEPLAMAYAGHQFGQWAGQLGDGRGLLMAQVRDQHNQLTDLHLKGAGLTPYSRMGDGRAVLRSTIREYLCGHAMTQLGIASSSALGFVVSETAVRREQMEAGAALLRVSDCHIRLGHVEWIASFAPDLLQHFTDYMIDTYYPQSRDAPYPVLDFLTQVVKHTAVMIANWQLIGFAHGVMNTDNLSITGTTIDYGPFGFLERFNPAWINNHSDYTGRYAYQNQPAIGHWNLNVWLPHFMRLTQQGVTKEGLADCLAHYESTFMRHYQQGICQKIGLANTAYDAQEDSIQDADMQTSELRTQSLTLAYDLLSIIEQNRLDYTNSFRALLAVVDANHSDNSTAKFAHEHQLLQQINAELPTEQLALWQVWQTRYLQHIAQHANVEDVLTTLAQHNPVYILRNAMAQRCIKQAQSGDFSEVDRVFRLLTQPYSVQDIATAADITPPAPDAPEMVISCSS